ncbi:MAG: TIR domain-containing protein [Verrucomicrobiales bacterium]|nr:TIR domain-containing protein [Verrucomicrobiales bacterium]
MSEEIPATEFEFWAFISYSHKDVGYAEWLHRGLEYFDVPDDIIGKKTGKGYQVPDRLKPIFRDVDEIPTTSDLGETITDALKDSRYLIVVCSPSAVQSLWVNEEILVFKRLGKANRILIMVVDGVPNAGDTEGLDPALECFPEALRYELDENGNLDRTTRTDPLWADCRERLPDGRSGGGRERAFLRVVAGLLGVDFEDVYRRHERAARRVLVIWGTVSTTLLALFAGLAFFAIQQRDTAKKASSDLGNLVDYTIDDLQGTLQEAGRLELMRAPLYRVENILKESAAKSPQALGRLGHQQAKIVFDSGDKTAAIENLESIRDQLLLESKSLKAAQSHPLYRLKRLFGFEIGDEQAVRETLAAVLTTLGDYQGWKEGRVEPARKSCEEAIRIYEELLRADPDDSKLRLGLGYSQNYLADLLGKELETDKAITLYETAESHFSQAELTPFKFGETNQFLKLAVRGRLRTANLLNRDRRLSEALSALDSANEIIDAQLQFQPKNAVALEARSLSYQSRGTAYSLLKEPVKAAESFAIAIKAQEKLVTIEPQNDHYLRGLALVQLSIGENPNLEHEKRREAIEVGLKICEKGQVKDPSNMDWKKALGRAYRLSGDRDLNDRRFGDAVDWYEKLIDLGQKDSEKDEIGLLIQIAGGRVNYSRALLNSASEDQRLDRSADVFKQLKIAESVYDKAYSLHQDSDYLRDKAVVLDARGETFVAIKNRKEARKAFLGALLLRKQLLVEASPDNKSLIISDLAVNHDRLARVDRELEMYSDALDNFQEAITFQTQLVDQFPENHEFRLSLARFLIGKSLTLQKSDDLDEAAATYSEAEKHLLLLLQQQSNHPDYLKELSQTNYRLSKIALEQDRAKEAVGFIRESWRDYLKLYQQETGKHRLNHLNPLITIAEVKAEVELASELPAEVVDTRRTLAVILKGLVEQNPGRSEPATAFAEGVVALGEAAIKHQPVPDIDSVVDLFRAAKLALTLCNSEGAHADLLNSLETLRSHIEELK